MKEKAVRPPAALSAIVNKYYLLQGEIRDKIVFKKLLPTYEILIIFSFGADFAPSFNDDEPGPLVKAGCFVTGLLKSPFSYRLCPKTDILVINLSPEGFYRLFQEDPQTLGLNRIVNADDCVNQRSFLIPLWHRLRLLKSDQRRLELLNITLGAKATVDPSLLNPVARGLVALEESPGFSGKSLAGEYHIHPRTVQLKFKKVLGYSAKELIRFKRFRKLLDRLQAYQGEEPDWVSLVIEFGYYDQSHLSRDFRYYLHATPNSFVKNIQNYCFALQPE